MSSLVEGGLESCTLECKRSCLLLGESLLSSVEGGHLLVELRHDALLTMERRDRHQQVLVAAPLYVGVRARSSNQLDECLSVTAVQISPQPTRLNLVLCWAQ